MRRAAVARAARVAALVALGGAGVLAAAGCGPRAAPARAAAEPVARPAPVELDWPDAAVTTPAFADAGPGDAAAAPASGPGDGRAGTRPGR